VCKGKKKVKKNLISRFFSTFLFDCQHKPQDFFFSITLFLLVSVEVFQLLLFSLVSTKKKKALVCSSFPKTSLVVLCCNAFSLPSVLQFFLLSVDENQFLFFCQDYLLFFSQRINVGEKSCFFFEKDSQLLNYDPGNEQVLVNYGAFA
jgi:hypothetical protein